MRERAQNTAEPTHLLHLSPSRLKMGTEYQAVFPCQQGFSSLPHLQEHLPFPEEGLQGRKNMW